MPHYIRAIFRGVRRILKQKDEPAVHASGCISGIVRFSEPVEAEVLAEVMSNGARWAYVRTAAPVEGWVKASEISLTEKLPSSLPE